MLRSLRATNLLLLLLAGSEAFLSVDAAGPSAPDAAAIAARDFAGYAHAHAQARHAGRSAPRIHRKRKPSPAPTPAPADDGPAPLLVAPADGGKNVAGVLGVGRYSPALVSLGAFLAIGAAAITTEPLPPLTEDQAQPDSLGLSFNLSKVVDQAKVLSTKSWEYGTAAQMLLEVYEPSASVWGTNISSMAFPGGNVPKLDPTTSPSLQYARQFIDTNGSDEVENALIKGDGSSGDPASLGVAAIMIGQTERAYASAARRQVNHLLRSVPRWSNGAISHREDKAVLWADWMYMVPPVLAYQAVATNNTDLMTTTVQQITAYREVLRIKKGPIKGAWRHIVGPEAQSLGAWTTGQAWASLGMARVLATMSLWPNTGTLTPNPNDTARDAARRAQEAQAWTNSRELIKGYIYEIFDAVEASISDAATRHSGLDTTTGLLRGYLMGGDKSTLDLSFLWPGDTTGSSGVAAAMYRMAVLDPTDEGGKKYLSTANALKTAVSAATDPVTGLSGPAMDPLGWWKHDPVYNSPEGASLVAMMAAAYRDCVQAATCDLPPPPANSAPSQQRIALSPRAT